MGAEERVPAPHPSPVVARRVDRPQAIRRAPEATARRAPAVPCRQLTVLYDPHCGLCREARAWLEMQATFVPLVFVGAGTALAAQRFPGLDHADTLRRLTVVTDRGAVYRGVRAWLMVMWALREWRDRSITLAWTPLRPFVAAGLWLVSALRLRTRCEGACGTGP